jgi:hypothetical protein
MDGGGTDASDGGGGGDGGGGACLGSKVLESLGIGHVLAGASMEDATAASAPFDLRYIYISGGYPSGAGPCTSCNTCSASWWGCWQDPAAPPGAYVRDFVATAKSNKQIPMITYYELLQSSGVQEGAPEVTQAANDATFMARFFADWRFLLQQIGNEVAFLHVEPDFWGYAEQSNQDPHQSPAAVASANAMDCSGMENSIAGMGRCMIAMVRKYAKNAKVGLHASDWGTLTPAMENKSATFDLASDAAKLGTFMLAAGAGEGDYVVLDASDRDAGYYQSIGRNTWWDATNATLPNFTQAFAWSKLVAEKVGLGLLWWQLPVGNVSQNDTTDHWKDNRVDYFFAHTADLAASHAIGMAFGAGAGGQTTPESDGGNLVSKVKVYAGGQKYCP